MEFVGERNIPKEGAVIFAGNHANQMVDGAILASCIRGHSPSFLVAEKSMRRPIIGWFARATNSIPVRRPQDEGCAGSGRVESVRGREVRGDAAADFLSDVQPGCVLLVGEQSLPPVEAVADARTLRLCADAVELQDLPARFKVLPKVDQTGVFDYVMDALGRGRSIGIFPEGGSHDRTTLLPLKVGVALMALGAVARHHRRVSIVPCGLNYFSGHRFRSSVVVEYGPPIVLEPGCHLMVLYARSRREACSALLADLTAALNRVVITAPDLETLRALQLARKLYTPPDVVLDSEQFMELNRRLSLGSEKFADDPEVRSLRDDVLKYGEDLENCGLHDYQIATPAYAINDASFLILVVQTFVSLCILLLLALPGTVINLPIGVASKLVARRKAREALAASRVKIKGDDVIATYKFLLAFVLVPVLYLIYATVIALFKGLLYAILAFVVLPFFSYASVRMFETGFRRLRFLRHMLTLERSRKVHSHLHARRNELHARIRAVVDRLGPKVVDDFAHNRVVPLSWFDEGISDSRRREDPLRWRAYRNTQFAKRTYDDLDFNDISLLDLEEFL